MAKILVIYSTVDGHTRKICDHLKQVLEERNNRVVLVSFDDEKPVELEQFDKIVIGASIRYGKHRPNVRNFIERNQRYLDSKPNALFSVSVVARKPGKNTPETNPYLKRFLNQISWEPKLAAVFAGKIDYPRYNFFDRTIIRLIMWITKGPTHPQTVVEFTDWGQVEAFGQSVNDMD